MKISIITVSYNSERFIGDAMRSVLNQTYPDIEYLIIDGASKDATLAIAESYHSDFGKRLHIRSEPDAGIYDAMNKGIAYATGEIIGFLNSDDELASPKVIEAIANKFAASNKQIVFGDLVYVDQFNTNRIIRSWRTGPTPKNGMRFGWHPPHPSFYVKRAVLFEYGGFQTRYKISADYEQMVRFLERFRLSAAYLPMIFVKMRTGGVSNRSFRNILLANLECIRAWKDNGISISPLIIILKLYSKITQLFNRRQKLDCRTF